MTTPSTGHPEPARAHRDHPSLSPASRARLTQAQAYEDAIAYRRARLRQHCPACGTGRCDDHATDADLITAYQQGRRRALSLIR